MRKLLYIVFCLQVILFAPLSLALGTQMKADNTATEDRTQVQKAYYDWTRAIETAKGNPDGIVALYAPNAILLATLSPQIKRNVQHSVSQELFDFTNTDIKDYFVDFSSLKDMHVITERLYTQLFNDVAINTGLYTFEYLDDQGKKVDVNARFTFVYEKIGNKWLIINHHSSFLPPGKPETK